MDPDDIEARPPEEAHTTSFTPVPSRFGAV